MSTSGLKWCLSMGPSTMDRFTEPQLRRGWQVYGGELLREERPFLSGTRPWGWWRFEAGEERPRPRGDQTVRLAELGELRDEELAKLRERANEARLRVGTPHERVSGGALGLSPEAYSVDAQAVELWERVEAALKR
jgi:hypothetical protein